jgi:hypothetical protein
MTYTRPPDDYPDYPDNRRATWPARPAEPVYRAPAAPIVPPEEIEAQRESARRRWTVGRVGQIIYILFGVLEALLIIRFALKLLGANPAAAFSSFIYGLTEVFVAPFEGVFPSPQTNGSVLELATLLAIIVYALLAWLVVSVLDTLASRRPPRMV